MHETAVDVIDTSGFSPSANCALIFSFGGRYGTYATVFLTPETRGRVGNFSPAKNNETDRRARSHSGGVVLYSAQKCSTSGAGGREGRLPDFPGARLTCLRTVPRDIGGAELPGGRCGEYTSVFSLP